jgi:hypothetical protein
MAGQTPATESNIQHPPQSEGGVSEASQHITDTFQAILQRPEFASEHLAESWGC